MSSEKLVWRRLSDYAMAPFKRSGEQMPFTVCKVGNADGHTFEAWDCRGVPRQLKVGLKSYQDAQTEIEIAMRMFV